MVEACGGDETENTPVPDAGNDVVADVAKEAAKPVEEDAAGCDLNADFTKNIPDASIADGASTTGICLACAKAKCAAEIDKCNKDCPCQTIADDALQCFVKNSNKQAIDIFTACGKDIQGTPPGTQTIALGLGQCVLGNCKTECPADLPSDAGKDANDGGDGG